MGLALYLLWVLKTMPATQGSPLPRLSSGSPVPLGNSTALNNDIAPAWMPSAQVRGTSDILYSCLLTISLSVYSAVHINVPPRGASRKWQYIQKAKWTVLGIFAPEIVVYTAVYQFYKALELQKRLTDIVKRRRDEAAAKQPTDPVTTVGLAKLGENAIAEGENKTRHESAETATSKRPLSAENAATRAPTFSLIYCFFVGMGGFIVDVRDFGYKHQYVTLTARDLEQLALRGKFVEIKESEITDKSKADILAKILVCFQVTWLLVDCLARKVAGYPLTILEVHTFVHVFCTVVMYSLWIKKPLNVGEARLVSDLDEEFYDNLCLRITNEELYVIRFTHSRPSFARGVNLAQYTSRMSSSEEVTCNNVGIVQRPPGVRTRSLVSGQQLSEGLVLNLYVGEVRGCPCNSTAHKIQLTLSEGDLACWKQISRMVHRKYPGLVGQLTGTPAYKDRENTRISELTTSMCNPDNGDETETLGLRKTTEEHGSSASTREPGQRQVEAIEDENHLLPTNSFANDFGNFLPGDLLSRAVNFDMGDFSKFVEIWNFRFSVVDAFTMTLLAVLLGLMTAYGGIHLSVWGYEFPTETERWLWRVTSINVTAFGWFFAVFGLLYQGFSRLVEFGKLETLFFWLCIIMLCSASLLCAASRLFIVVESFISLRTVPIGVYAAIPWAQYIPHI